MRGKETARSRALQFMRQGAWEKAIEEYDRQDEFADPLCANDYAVTLHQAGRYEEALQVLKNLGNDDGLPLPAFLNLYYMKEAARVKTSCKNSVEHKDHDGLPCPKERPLVSVMVRTFNRPDFLEEALQSLSRQTFQDFEAIVVNDGGDPQAGEVVKSSGLKNIRYYHAPHQGNAAVLNRAMEMAHGKFVTMLDDDDIFYPEHLEAHVNYLESPGAAPIAFPKTLRVKVLEEGHKRTVNEGDKNVRGRPFDRGALFENNYMTPMAVVSMDCYLNKGNVCEELSIGEDWEMWLRLSETYKVHHIDRVTGEHREREKGDNVTVRKLRKRPYYNNTIRMMHKGLIIAGGPRHDSLSAGYPKVMDTIQKALHKKPELIDCLELADLWTMRKPYAWLLEQAEWLKKIDEPDIAMEFIKSAARLAPYQPRVWKRMRRTAKLTKQ